MGFIRRRGWGFGGRAGAEVLQCRPVRDPLFDADRGKGGPALLGRLSAKAQALAAVLGRQATEIEADAEDEPHPLTDAANAATALYTVASPHAAPPTLKPISKPKTQP